MFEELKRDKIEDAQLYIIVICGCVSASSSMAISNRRGGYLALAV